ncbi:MAG: hypothetical protein AVDCRST_MAG11-2806, partial [uncultured Gemmatimonadaceae bacterium]
GWQASRPAQHRPRRGRRDGLQVERGPPRPGADREGEGGARVERREGPRELHPEVGEEPGTRGSPAAPRAEASRGRGRRRGRDRV